MFGVKGVLKKIIRHETYYIIFTVFFFYVLHQRRDHPVYNEKTDTIFLKQRGQRFNLMKNCFSLSVIYIEVQILPEQHKIKIVMSQ
jgi:hypothetical protein